MNNKIRTLLIEDDEKIINDVKKYFSSHANIEIVDFAFHRKLFFLLKKQILFLGFLLVVQHKLFPLYH